MSHSESLSTDILQPLLPKHWYTNPEGEIPIKVQISSESQEFKDVVKDISKFVASHKVQVYRVQNAHSYCRYKLRELEYQSRGITYNNKTLMHSTDRDNVPHIISNNLDWRKVTRSKFGKGVSFSPCPSYADDKSNNRNGKNRTMIVCDVIVGKTSIGGYNTKMPPKGCDTTCDRYQKVFVKYYDDEFYPKYLIDYDKKHVAPRNPRRHYNVYHDYDDLDFDDLPTCDDYDSDFDYLF